jgi:hypothetical protein
MGMMMTMTAMMQLVTYIVGCKDGRSAEREQGERRPLEVDHCAGFREGGVDE